MIWDTPIRIDSTEPRDRLIDRLAAALLTRRAFAAQMTSGFALDALEATYRDKCFVGRLDDGHFDMIVTSGGAARVHWSGRSVIITGDIDDRCVTAKLRPPYFHLVFGALFTLFVGGVFVLSFFGPANTPIVHLTIAAMLIAPLAVLFAAYRWQRAKAIERLRATFAVQPR